MSFAKFTDVSFDAGGASWTAKIELWNGSSANNTLKLLSGCRRVGERRINPLNPVLPATLRTRIYDDGRTIHDKILNNPKSDLRITVKKGSTIWHQGLLQRVDGGETLGRSNPILRLTWNDGLPYLKTQNWNEQGRATLLKFLWYFCTDSSRTDLTTRVALAWNDTQADTSSGRSRALQHQLSRQLDEGTYWDAALQALRYYNMQVFQEDAKWRALHRSYREDGQSFDYEERDTGGTESSGSTNPTISLSDSDLYRPQGQEAKRRQFAVNGWRHEVQLNDTPWQNDNLTESKTDIDGNIVPRAWHLKNSPTYDINNNYIEIDPGNKGINKSNTAYAEQVFDRVLVYDEPNSTTDEITLVLEGEIDILETDETSNIGVPIAELTAINPNGQNYTLDSGGGVFSTTQTYYATSVAQSDNGTQTRSFSETVTVSAPSGESSTEWYILRLRLLSEQDPDNDLKNEVDKIRWTRADIKNYDENVERDAQRWRNGIQYSLAPVDDRETETTQIANPSHEQTETGPSDYHPRSGGLGLRFLDSRTSAWQFLHRNGSEANHATRSFSQSDLTINTLEAMRLHDRYAMMPDDLLRIIAVVKRGTLDLRDTITYDSRTWVPHFIEERISNEYKEIGLTELRNATVPSGAVDIKQL